MAKKKGKGKQRAGSASEQAKTEAPTELSTEDKNAKEVISGAEKIAEEDAKEKRKAEDENSGIVETPPKRRTVDQKKVDASVSSNEKSSSPYGFRPKRAIPCFRNIELNESEFEGVVGKRVKVLPSGSKKWITGVIESYDAKKKHHKVEYDDGLSSELDLTKEHFQLEVKPGEAYTLKGSSSGKGKNIKADDDDYDDETKKKKPSRAGKGKSIATETNEGEKDSSKLNDAEPVKKITKLGESPRARSDAKEAADAVAEAKAGPSKTKKAGDEDEVVSKEKPGRKARKKVRTRK